MYSLPSLGNCGIKLVVAFGDKCSMTVIVLSVVLTNADPETSKCFGGPFGQFISKYLLGYDMMIIASFKNLLHPTQGTHNFIS